MTTHDNTKAKLKAFDAFAPVADALDAIQIWTSRASPAISRSA